MNVFEIPERAKAIKHDQSKSKLPALTDLAICMGAIPIENETFLKNRYGFYWSKTLSEFNYPSYIDPSNVEQYSIERASCQNIGCRPIINDQDINGLPLEIIRFVSDSEIAIGEFPQSSASMDMSYELDEMFKSGSLCETGKEYILDVLWSTDDQKYDFSFAKEYLYKNKRYVLYTAQNQEFLSSEKYRLLSNGQKIINGSKVWLEVEPLIFERTKDGWIAKNIIFSSIPFSFVNDSCAELYHQSIIYQYINTCFVDSIMPSAIVSMNRIKSKKMNETDIMNVISFYSKCNSKDLQGIRLLLSELGITYLRLFDSLWIDGDLEKAKVFSTISEIEPSGHKL